MKSKLKCPFCQTELEQMHDKKMLGCPKCLHIADGALWAKVIQSQKDLNESHQATLTNAHTALEFQKDLEIARKALEEYADEDMWENCCKWDIEYMQGLFLEHGYEIAKKALEQIEQKEERNESIRSNTDD